MELPTPLNTSANSLSTLMNNIAEYKYNPVMIQQAILNYLQLVTNSEIDIVDPTNPFVYLLEASTVNTSAAMMENELNTRRLYPALATTMDDLYRHMSDSDFLDIFSTPATGDFYFVIEKNSLLSSLVENPTTGNSELIIGGNTFVIVNNMTFSLQYPIVITQYSSGNIGIAYDDSQISPIQTLNGTVIPYTKRLDANGVEWYTFKVQLTQISVESSIEPILDSTYFNSEFTYTDNFYYCRVFNQPTGSDTWAEMATTFSQQVYDPTTPTAVLQLLDNNTLAVSIPPVYVTSGLLTGNIRIDIYTTLGSINVNLNNYLINSFVTTFLDLNETTANSDYYATANNLIYLLYSDKIINGGSDGLTFSQLREQVINNSVGNPTLPITNAQLQNNIQEDGFTISPKTDVITQRTFIAYNSLPMPVNQDFITPVSVTMETVALSFNSISEYDTINVNSSQTRATILPTTLYQNLNGVVSIYNNPNVAIFQQLNLTALQELINNNNLLYSPYYYVLDASTAEFNVRVYDLDSPTATNLGFYGSNSTSEAAVNTGQFQFVRSANGYQLTLSTTSNQAYKLMPNGACGAQLSFISPITGNRNYIQGTLLGQNSSNEKIFQFNINTDFDVDSSNNIYVKGNNSNSAYTDISMSLSQSVDIIYYITNIPSGFKPNSFQSYLNTSIIVNNTGSTNILLAAITHDEITLNFGSYLGYLWAQYRSVMSNNLYTTYTRDVPLRYTEDQYETDPTTGSILTFDSNGNPTFTQTASAGDQVLDKNGNPIYKYLAGDTVLDANGNPEHLIYENITRYIDILMFDATFYFITHQATIDYIDSTTELITQWCTTSLATINQSLIELTDIYYYPQKTNSTVAVTLTNNTIVTIETGQVLTIVFVVPQTVYVNLKLQARIKAISTGLISNYFSNNTIISVSQIGKQLLEQFGDDVLDAQISGLGGASNNYPFLTINDDSYRLSLNKQLSLLSDNTLTVIESVNYSFISG